MKKKSKLFLAILLFLGCIYYLVSLMPITPSDQHDLRVLLIYNPRITGTQEHILNAYRSVLEEEGIPFKAAAPSFILSEEPVDMVTYFPVILLPDGIARSLPSDLRFWIKEYMERGGDVAIIYDAGSQNLRFQYLNRGLFSDLLGLNYVLYNKMRDSNDAYTNAYIRFKDKRSAELFQLPPGKTDDKFFINGYSYGQLIFPIARVRTERKNRLKDTYAYAVTEAGETYPAIIMKKVFSGNLLYVNLPLGHLKAHSDDLLLRAVLRTFLLDTVKIPHLVNTPGGVGGLVINWHIDWSEDWEGLNFMKRNGYFFDDIRYSIHNTAGNFTDRPGDGLGFDAAGKGKPILESVLKYGTLGSHGGWAHNWFYQNILSGNFGEKEIETYIVKNNKTLEKISGYPVTEYSAPNGVHPQPLVTRILERNGVIAYYYTGDSGSAPNRTFYDKKMVSKHVIAFPVLSYRSVASFFEMNRDGIKEREIQKWLDAVLDFVVRHRTIRLIYSHSYDVPPYFPRTVKTFLRNVDEQCKEGKLIARPMSYFAKHMHHFLKTRCRFRKKPEYLEVRLYNPDGLRGTVVAIPVDFFQAKSMNGVELEKDRDYYYLRLKENVHEKKIYIGYRTGMP
jgi:hypothetical protein